MNTKGKAKNAWNANLRRALSIFLAMAMVVALLPSVLFADEPDDAGAAPALGAAEQGDAPGAEGQDADQGAIQDTAQGTGQGASQDAAQSAGQDTAQKSEAAQAESEALPASLGLLGAGTAIDAADIYIGAAGDDDTGDGSLASPFATLQKAVDQAAAAATIHVVGSVAVTGQVTIPGAKAITLNPQTDVPGGVFCIVTTPLRTVICSMSIIRAHSSSTA
ncbi:MAG: hypothetical protein LBS91_07270 [Clostridiales Family XIII bacterium]|jgi:hypothetical protein|nr:hypothetical protein [Clostridiales Family XIII bacterium]